MGIALKSRQVKIDLIYACVQDLMFLSRGDRDHGDAFQTHPVSQASARGKQRILISSWVAIGISWSPLSGLQGVKPPVELERGLGIALQAIQEEKALSSQ